MRYLFLIAFVSTLNAQNQYSQEKESSSGSKVVHLYSPFNLKTRKKVFGTLIQDTGFAAAGFGIPLYTLSQVIKGDTKRFTFKDKVCGSLLMSFCCFVGAYAVTKLLDTWQLPGELYEEDQYEKHLLLTFSKAGITNALTGELLPWDLYENVTEKMITIPSIDRYGNTIQIEKPLYVLGAKDEPSVALLIKPAQVPFSDRKSFEEYIESIKNMYNPSKKVRKT